MIGTILGNVDVITLGVNVETEMGYFDGSFDGSYDCKIELLLFGDSLGSTYGKVICSDEGIKLGLFCCELICAILGNVY